MNLTARTLLTAVIAAISFAPVAFAQSSPPSPSPTVGVIKGKVVDYNTGLGAPSGSYPWTRIVLAQLDANYAVVNTWYSDCYNPPKNGCVRADGVFKFRGIFPVATYQLTLNADGRLQQVYWIQYTGGTMNIGLISIEQKPVFVRVDYMSEFPPSGQNGRIEFTYRIVDQSGDPDTEHFKAHVTITATGTTGEYIPFPARLQPAGSVRGNSVSFTDFVDIPYDLPAGAYLCVTVQVSRKDSPFNGLDQTGECRVKGGYSGGKG